MGELWHSGSNLAESLDSWLSSPRTCCFILVSVAGPVLRVLRQLLLSAPGLRAAPTGRKSPWHSVLPTLPPASWLLTSPFARIPWVPSVGLSHRLVPSHPRRFSGGAPPRKVPGYHGTRVPFCSRCQIRSVLMVTVPLLFPTSPEPQHAFNELARSLARRRSSLLREETP